MLTASQLRAARALLGIDQRKLAELSGLSVPTIQRMEAGTGVIRGQVGSLMKLIAALELHGIEVIAECAPSQGGGRGVCVWLRWCDRSASRNGNLPTTTDDSQGAA